MFGIKRFLSAGKESKSLYFSATQHSFLCYFLFIVLMPSVHRRIPISASKLSFPHVNFDGSLFSFL